MQQVSHSPVWTVDAPPVDRNQRLVPCGQRCHSIFEPQTRTRRLDHPSRELWASACLLSAVMTQNLCRSLATSFTEVSSTLRDCSAFHHVLGSDFLHWLSYTTHLILKAQHPDLPASPSALVLRWTHS